MLGARDDKQYAAIQDALVFLASPAAKSVDAVLAALLDLGGVNLRTMVNTSLVKPRLTLLTRA
jgi:hypothetical protein